ncbi:AsmA-like C-terminal region-containing protein [Gluconobacter oxydans]|uniref:YhdP family protein n=1 Tax=Gluconobacter oxydans TaxID=442 RepID=UPI0039EAE853
MAVPDFPRPPRRRFRPFCPGPQFPRHLHIARWAALVCVTPIALVAAAGSVFLWELAHGPVDITRVSHLVEPVSIAAGKRPGHPAGRLSWDTLRIQWQPAAGGVPAGLVLMARGLKVTRFDNLIAERAEEADAVLSLSALFEGVIAPRTLRLENATLALRRLPDGDVDMDLPNQKRGGRGVPTRLDRLRAIDVHNVSVTLAGLPQDRTAVIGPVEMQARRIRVAPHSPDFVWTGTARTMVMLDGFRTTLTAQARQVGNTGRLHLGSMPFEPAALGVFSPLAADWHVPVSVGADAVFVPHGMDEQPSELTVTLSLGDGQLFQKTADPIHLHAGQASVHLRMDHPGLDGGATVSVPSAGLDVADNAGALTHVHASASLRLDNLRQPKVMDGDAEAGLDGVRFATLGSIWPASIIKGGRRWISRNITDGTGRDLEVKAHLHGDHGPDSILPVSVQGQLTGRGLTVNWLRPVPPATGLDASLHFDGPETLVIDLSRGVQPTGVKENVLLPDGEIRIGDLYAKDQTGDISTHLTGPLAGFMSALAHPRLHLLARHPLPFTHPDGMVDAHVRLTLPLVAHIPDGALHVWTQATFSGVHLGNVLMGQPVDGASGKMSATEDGLDLTGDGRLAGIPTHVVLHENFQGGAPSRVLQTIDARSVLDPQSTAKARIAPGGLFDGHAVLNAHFVQQANEMSDLKLSLDMAQAALTVPIWAKPMGEPATAMVHIGFQKGRMSVLDGLQAHGTGLSVAGRGVTRAGKLTGIVLEGFRIGRTEGDARIALPQAVDQPIGVTVDADPLDLAPMFAPHPPTVPAAAPRGGSGEKSVSMGDSWSISLNAPHVYYGPKAQVGGVVSQIELRNGHLASGRFALDAPTRVRAVLADTGREHPFVLDIDNLGTLLEGLGLYDRIRGGQTHLDGVFTPDETTVRKVPEGRNTKSAGLWGGLPPFRGHVEMGPSQFLRPPLTLTAVSDLSPLHWLTNHLDRFEISHLATRLSLAGNLLVLHDGVIGNQALGATMEGPIDLTTSKLNLNGTIVPLFGLNALPGRLPVLGHLLSPEKGGGLLAATFDLHGTVEKPDLSVNPLSMLLPGVMRRILH